MFKMVKLTVNDDFSCVFLLVVCHSGANARANVPTQDVQPQPERLSKDLSVPEVAKNGGPSR